MSNLTTNTSLLSLANFKLILNSKDFSNTEFFAVSANIPSVSVGEIPANYRNEAGYLPGEKMNYDQLTVRILLDENFAAYTELFNWMKGNTNHAQLKFADMTLIVMSSHNNPNTLFKFVNLFPVSLGTVDFNNQNADIEYTALDVSFRYDYFTFVSAADQLVC